METDNALRMLRRRWWLLALPVALCAIVALPPLFDSAPTGFNAQIRYSAAQPLDPASDENGYTNIWHGSELLIHAFTDWARTSSFRAELAAQLGEQAGALSGLGIAADNSRSIGVVYLNHRDHDSLVAVVSAAQAVLKSRSGAYFPQLGGQAAQVTILDVPGIGAVPPSMSARLTPLVQLGISLLLGIGLALLAEHVDQRIHHQDDLRRMGVTLLASIPPDSA